MTKKSAAMPLAVMMMAAAFLFGGFYEAVSCLLSAAMGGYLLYRVCTGKKLKLYWNAGIILAAVVVAGYLLSCVVAVDRGMALLGVVKVLPLLLFALILMQFSEEEREELLFTVPVSGVLIAVASMLLYWIPAARDLLYLSGRLGGTFQYSNTMALYFLAGIMIIQGKKERSGKTAVVCGILFLGVLLTGSRSVFLFTVIVLVLGAWRFKKYRIFNLSAITAGAAGGAVYAMLSGDYQNLGRFLTISLSNSTLAGRFLYWQDALSLVISHPLGLGYMGYFYSQGQVQTGVYTTVFVHNDLLQLILDAGWLPGIIVCAVFMKSLLSKEQDGTAKAVMTVIAIHSLFDFNMQYLSVAFVCLLTLECRKTEKLKIMSGKKIADRAVLTGILAAMAVSLCALIPSSAFLTGNLYLAAAVYPYYTEANLMLLENAGTREEGEALADQILKTNQNAALAYDAKALSSAMDGDFHEMIRYKELALLNHPYALYEYVDYAALLGQAVAYSQETGDQEGEEYYIQCLKTLPERLKELEKRTSPLGWMIRDLPETELPEEVTAYIESL